MNNSERTAIFVKLIVVAIAFGVLQYIFIDTPSKTLFWVFITAWIIGYFSKS